MFTVYLIHFENSYYHARHYLGYCFNLDRRLGQHTNGTGSRLIKAINQENIGWEVARTWRLQSKQTAISLEKKLKSWKKSSDFCPLCNPESSSSRAIYDKMGECNVLGNLGENK